MGNCTSAHPFRRGDEDGLESSIRQRNLFKIEDKITFFNRNRCFTSGENPMTLAVGGHNENVVDCLVHSGASVNRKDRFVM